MLRAIPREWSLFGLLVLVSFLSMRGCLVRAPSIETGVQAPRAQPSGGPREFRPGANLGDAVELTAFLVQPGTPAPGDTVRAQFQFKVLKALPADYLVFVHVEDAEGRTEKLNVDHAPVQGRYPTSQWKPGDTVRDEFQIYLPPSAGVRQYRVWMGLWDPKSNARLPLTNPQTVRNDGQNRVLAGELQLTL